MNNERLVFASGNRGKIDEVRLILKNTDYHVMPMIDLGIEIDIPETGNTLEENAIIKAKYVYERFDVNVFSEDTGLEVDALDGQPGVHTARYAGPKKSAEDNMNKLLKALENKKNRKARFHAVICLILNGKQHLFHGYSEGNIAKTKSGNQGFGYDPIFIPVGHQRTFAEMDEKEKKDLSHRNMAMQKLLKFISNQTS